MTGKEKENKEYNKPPRNLPSSGSTRDGNLSHPIFFFGGNRHMKSDFPWIVYHLSRLPLELKIKASREYEQLYLRGINKTNITEARRTANSFLASFCDEHGSSKEQVKEVRQQSSEPGRKELSDKLIELKKLSRQKKSILGIAEKLKRK